MAEAPATCVMKCRRFIIESSPFGGSQERLLIVLSACGLTASVSRRSCVRGGLRVCLRSLTRHFDGQFLRNLKKNTPEAAETTFSVDGLSGARLRSVAKPVATRTSNRL